MEDGKALTAASIDKQLSRTERLMYRNRAITDRFNVLYKKGYRRELVCRQLEIEYGLAQATIAKIVSKEWE